MKDPAPQNAPFNETSAAAPSNAAAPAHAAAPSGSAAAGASSPLKKQAFNPFLPLDEYIPDGEPHVFGGRVYLFGSHDKEGGTEYCQTGDYVGWSAPVDDLTSWRYEGVIYSADRQPGGKGKCLYAPDVVRGNDGKYYLYYCLGDFEGGIFVAVADSPCGDYRFLGEVRLPDGSPLRRFVPADPAVLNDNGVIRLYYGWSLSTNAAKANRGHDVPPEQFKEMLLMGETRLFHRTREEVEGEEGGSLMGAVACTLKDDMLTVDELPRRILPGQFMAEGTSFEGHAFYEASSIRKVGGLYYFIYSSQLSHELCYATSRYPDRGFTFRGTIVSNGDVGLSGRREEDRLNQTANNHGSIECINGRWYIFYHRQTHRSTFSRQACAEPVQLLADGCIPQVEMTSCGLNGGPLLPEGVFPAPVCCNLTNGHMPHITNRAIEEDIPFITHGNDERYIANIADGTLIAYKYFAFEGSYRLSLWVRGTGEGEFEVKIGEETAARIPVAPSVAWQQVEADLTAHGTSALRFLYHGAGRAEFLQFALHKN